MAQRDIRVVDMAQAQRTGSHFLVTNPLCERATLVLRAAAPRVARSLEREQGLLASRGNVALAPDESVHCSLAFTAPRDARPGDVHLVSVAQSDSRRRAVGGLWVALVA